MLDLVLDLLIVLRRFQNSSFVGKFLSLLPGTVMTYYQTLTHFMPVVQEQLALVPVILRFNFPIHFWWLVLNH